MPKRNDNTKYFGFCFETVEDKKLADAILNDLKDKTAQPKPYLVMQSLLEYRKLFDDKGNRI